MLRPVEVPQHTSTGARRCGGTRAAISLPLLVLTAEVWPLPGAGQAVCPRRRLNLAAAGCEPCLTRAAVGRLTFERVVAGGGMGTVVGAVATVAAACVTWPCG